MNQFFLKAASEPDIGGFMSPERLELAGQVFLIGMFMVFAVLALLWGILAIFGKVMTRQKKQADEPAPEAPAEEIAPAVSEPESAAASVEDDGELIAVITAAVAAAIESDEVLSSRFESGFRVVSFKKSTRSARGNRIA